MTVLVLNFLVLPRFYFLCQIVINCCTVNGSGNCECLMGLNYDIFKLLTLCFLPLHIQIFTFLHAQIHVGLYFVKVNSWKIDFVNYFLVDSVCVFGESKPKDSYWVNRK